MLYGLNGHTEFVNNNLLLHGKYITMQHIFYFNPGRIVYVCCTDVMIYVTLGAQGVCVDGITLKVIQIYVRK